MFEIIRIVFGVFLVSQAVLLLVHRHVKIPVTQNGLKWSFIFKVMLIVAYGVYVSWHHYQAENLILPTVYFSQAMMRFLACLLEIFLCFLVWFTLLQHTVQKSKIYQMYDLAQKKHENIYKVYGTIREGAHEFSCVAIVSHEDYMLLTATGYFDKAGSHKTLPVRYLNFASGDDTYGVTIEVSLALNE